jgi:hypothetical protein
MSHPCLVTIDSRSAPRPVLGDQLVDVDLPTGTRVVYPKPPHRRAEGRGRGDPLRDQPPVQQRAALREAPPGMKVTIAIDDISLPLPPMKRPDIRERVLTVVLDLLADHGVDDVEMIIATSFHRRMKGWEVRHMVGDKIFNAYWPKKLYNHDAENPTNMSSSARPSSGEGRDQPRAVESDLIIYVNLNFVPMDGGHKSVAVGLCGYRSLRRTTTRRSCATATRTWTRRRRASSTRASSGMGRLLQAEAERIFTIETTINNRMFDRPLEFLAKNEDDLSAVERAALRALMFTLDKAPQAARQAVFERVPVALRRDRASSPARPRPVHEHT